MPVPLWKVCASRVVACCPSMSMLTRSATTGNSCDEPMGTIWTRMGTSTCAETLHAASNAASAPVEVTSNRRKRGPAGKVIDMGPSVRVLTCNRRSVSRPSLRIWRQGVPVPVRDRVTEVLPSVTAIVALSDWATVGTKLTSKVQEEPGLSGVEQVYEPMGNTADLPVVVKLKGPVFEPPRFRSDPLTLPESGTLRLACHLPF